MTPDWKTEKMKKQIAIGTKVSYQLVAGKTMFTATVTGYNANRKLKPYILTDEHGNTPYANPEYLVIA